MTLSLALPPWPPDALEACPWPLSLPILTLSGKSVPPPLSYAFSGSGSFSQRPLDPQ
jgi:hypothetical protein